jgi:phosphohistidine phosphatase
MHIYLLRHGDAINGSSFHDSERPLSDLGNRQAAIAGKYLKQFPSFIELILASPLKRAQETAALVQVHTGCPKIETTEYLVNGTDHRQLLNQLSNSNAVMALLVGHIPHLEDTITLLTGIEDPMEIEMKKCSLACVEIGVPIQPESGALKYLIHIKDMEARLQS